MSEKEVMKTVSSEPISNSEFDVNMAQFYLDSLQGIPESEKKKFTNFYLMFGKQTRLAIIKREDIPSYNRTLAYIIHLLDLGYYDLAIQTEVEVLQELNLTASIEGRQMEIGFAGVSRTENLSRHIGDSEKKLGRLSRIFGGKKKEEVRQYGGNER